MTKFVNIEPYAVREREAMVKLPPLPAEYLKLREAVDGFWLALNTRPLCAACNEGKVDRWSKGCCGYCPNLTTTGCFDKPVCCGLWICKYLADLMGAELANTVYHMIGPGFGGFRMGGLANDHSRAWTQAELARLVGMTKTLLDLTVRVKAGEFKTLTPDEVIARYRHD